MIADCGSAAPYALSHGPRLAPPAAALAHTSTETCTRHILSARLVMMEHKLQAFTLQASETSNLPSGVVPRCQLSISLLSCTRSDISTA